MIPRLERSTKHTRRGERCESHLDAPPHTQAAAAHQGCEDQRLEARITPNPNPRNVFWGTRPVAAPRHRIRARPATRANAGEHIGAGGMEVHPAEGNIMEDARGEHEGDRFERREERFAERGSRRGSARGGRGGHAWSARVGGGSW